MTVGALLQLFRFGGLGGTHGLGPEPIRLHMALSETSHPLSARLPPAAFFAVYVCFHTDSTSTAVRFPANHQAP